MGFYFIVPAPCGRLQEVKDYGAVNPKYSRFLNTGEVV